MVLYTVGRMPEGAAFAQDRREACDRSFVKGPSRARRQLGILTRSLFPVGSVNDRETPIAGAHKMFLKRKSSAGAGFSHLVAPFIGWRGRRRALIESGLVLSVCIFQSPENPFEPQLNPGSHPL